MNPSEQIAALIAAGAGAKDGALFLLGQSICYDGRFVGPDGDECGGAERIAEADDAYAAFFAQAANAREAIRLAHEITEAAGELNDELTPWTEDEQNSSEYCQFCGATYKWRYGRVRTHNEGCKWLALDALLAKYRGTDGKE